MLDKMPQTAPHSIRWRGTHAHTDFDPLYSVSIAAKANLWDAIYPPDMKTAESPIRATPDPRLKVLLEQHDAPCRTAWMYTPTAVVPLYPLSFFGYPTALGIWIALNAVALVWLAILLRFEFEHHRLPDKWANLLLAVFVTGMPVGALLTTQNLSLWFAVAILLVIRGLRNGTTTGPVFGFILQGVTKGFSAVWVPLLFIWKKWSLLAWGAAMSAVLVGLSFLLGCKWETYLFFFTDVVPAVKGADFIRGDGFPFLLKLLAGADAPPSWLPAVCSILLVVSLGLVYVFSWRAERIRNRVRDDIDLFRGLALFLSFLLFQSFSNVCWPFYRVHLLAFLPLCIRICMNRKRLALLFVLSMGILWMPMLGHLLEPLAARPSPLSAFFLCPGAVGYFFLLAFGLTAFLSFKPRQ